MRAFGGVAIGIAMAAVIALAAATLLAADRHPGETLGGDTWAALALQAGAALALFAAGASIVVIRSAWLPGSLIALSGVAVLLAAIPLPEAGGAFLFSAGYVGGALAAALAGAGSLDLPASRAPGSGRPRGGRGSRRERGLAGRPAGGDLRPQAGRLLHVP